jgi:hypothetical protein
LNDFSRTKTRRAPRARASSATPPSKGTSGEHVPVYRGAKTEGAFVANGERYHITNGYGRPSADLPPGTPGHEREREGSHRRARDALLPRMLPEGSELTVRGPGGYVKVYKGLAD